MNEDPSQWLWRDPEQVQELLRQEGVVHGGLIAIGVILVQPFLTAASLDLSAKVCVVAFSVAIPVLATLVLINRQNISRRRLDRSIAVGAARLVARGCAFAGVVAGFWHILWIAGVGILAGGLVGATVQSVDFLRLRREQEPPPQEGGAPGGTGS